MGIPGNGHGSAVRSAGEWMVDLSRPYRIPLFLAFNQLLHTLARRPGILSPPACLPLLPAAPTDGVSTQADWLSTIHVIASDLSFTLAHSLSNFVATATHTRTPLS